MDGTLCIGCLLCVEACPYGALEAVARFIPVGDILEEVMRDRVFYGDLGGITISGGEPGLFPEEVLALLKLSKEHGISTVLETSGYFDERYLPDLVRYTDLFLWDFKDGDDKRHIHNTQVSHQKILQNLYRADALGAVTILRSPLIRGVNMDDTHFRKFAQVASSLKNCAGCELLPYHPYGSSKKVQLGFREDALKEMIPSEADILLAKKKLLDYLSVYYN
jgi:pyruvate formate lyase activating enzyme